MKNQPDNLTCGPGRWQTETTHASSRSMTDRLVAFDMHMLRMQKHYRRVYRNNIYLLNEAALRIQHWFFSKPKRCELPTDNEWAND